MEIFGLLVIVAIGIGIFALNNAADWKCPHCGHSFFG